MSEETNNEETEAAKAPEAGADSTAVSADSTASVGRFCRRWHGFSRRRYGHSSN